MALDEESMKCAPYFAKNSLQPAAPQPKGSGGFWNALPCSLRFLAFRPDVRLSESRFAEVSKLLLTEEDISVLFALLVNCPSEHKDVRQSIAIFLFLRCSEGTEDIMPNALRAPYVGWPAFQSA